MFISDVVIRALPTPEAGQRDVWDDALKGFGIRVSQGGSKTFVVLVNGNRKALGRYPTLSLADARKAARKLMAQQLLAPKERGPVRPNILLSDAIELYIEHYLKKNTRASTAGEAARILKKHLDFGTRQLGSIDTHDIMHVVDALAPSAANHCFATTRAFLRWCVRRRYLDRSPLDGLTMPHKTPSRERVLTDAELVTVWREAQQFPFPFGHIVTLLILTGQRVGEITALQWSWIGEDCITFPREITKNNTVHTIPLTPVTTSIIETVPQEHRFLFPSNTGERPYDGHNKAKARFETACDATWSASADVPIEHWTLHDLRRTFATIQARIGTPPHVTEALLNHKTGTRTSIQRVYDRHTYMPEMRAAMKKYERHLNDLFR
ncbi:MAG: site-specific integrase [Hyphomicrobium sp.]